MAIAIAIKRIYNALEELYIDGIQTNTELHRNILQAPEFISGGDSISIN